MARVSVPLCALYSASKRSKLTKSCYTWFYITKLLQVQWNGLRALLYHCARSTALQSAQNSKIMLYMILYQKIITSSMEQVACGFKAPCALYSALCDGLFVQCDGLFVQCDGLLVQCDGLLSEVLKFRFKMFYCFKMFFWNTKKVSKLLLSLLGYTRLIWFIFLWKVRTKEFSQLNATEVHVETFKMHWM